MSSGARLLIVEDEAQLVRTITSYLQSFPGEFEVVAADSGEAALELLESTPVDILLTDVRLPGLDGTEVVRRALEIRPGLKVLVMTAFSSRALRSRVLRDGALNFVEKPFDLPELRRLLLEAASSETGWSGSMHGLDLFDLTQLLILVRKTRAVLVKAGHREGRLGFVAGEIHHASTGDITGPEAYYEMVNWDGGAFGDLPDVDATEMERNVGVPAGHLMMEAARRRDEQMRTASAPPPPAPVEATPVELPEGVGELLAAYLTSSPHARFASVLDGSGDICSATPGSPPGHLDQLREWFMSLERGSNGSVLGRVVVEDAGGTLVLSPRHGDHRLLVVAQPGVPLAVVTQSVEGLERTIWRPDAA